MTSLIEKIVGFIAPHRCLSCGIEDNVLCDGCYQTLVMRPRPFCAICGRSSADWRLCPACRAASGLEHVWVGSRYEGLIEQLLHCYKFERLRAGFAPLSRLLADSLPWADWLVVAIPTAPIRVRVRGYDQTL